MCEYTYIVHFNLLTNTMAIHWQWFHYKQAACTVQADIWVTTYSLLRPLDESPGKQVCLSVMPLHFPLQYGCVLHLQNWAIPSAVSYIQTLGWLWFHHQQTTWQPGRTAGTTHLLGMWSTQCTWLEICEQKPGLEFLKVMLNRNNRFPPESFH